MSTQPRQPGGHSSIRVGSALFDRERRASNIGSHGLKFGAGAEEGASGNQGVHALEERLSVSVESWFREGVVGVFCPTVVCTHHTEKLLGLKILQKRGVAWEREDSPFIIFSMVERPIQQSFLTTMNQVGQRKLCKLSLIHHRSRTRTRILRHDRKYASSCSTTLDEAEHFRVELIVQQLAAEESGLLYNGVWALGWVWWRVEWKVNGN
ncbi:hypothetical protein V8E53_002186 [Lactarius tabidus]